MSTKATKAKIGEFVVVESHDDIEGDKRRLGDGDDDGYPWEEIEETEEHLRKWEREGRIPVMALLDEKSRFWIRNTGYIRGNWVFTIVVILAVFSLYFWQFFIVDWPAIVQFLLVVVELVYIRGAIVEYARKRPTVPSGDVAQTLNGCRQETRQQVKSIFFFLLLGCIMAFVDSISLWSGDQFGFDRWVFGIVASVLFVTAQLVNSVVVFAFPSILLNNYINELNRLTSQFDIKGTINPLSFDEAMERVSTLTTFHHEILGMAKFIELMFLTSFVGSICCFYGLFFTLESISIVLWFQGVIRVLLLLPSFLPAAAATQKVDLMHKCVSIGKGINWSTQEREQFILFSREAKLPFQVFSADVTFSRITRMVYITATFFLFFFRLSFSETLQSELGVPRILKTT